MVYFSSGLTIGKRLPRWTVGIEKDTSVCDYENETAYSQNMLEKYKLKTKN